MKKLNGCEEQCQLTAARLSAYTSGNERQLTINELSVPSSTTCVLTTAFPRSAQNVAATRPAWIAVTAVSAVDPYPPQVQ